MTKRSRSSRATRPRLTARNGRRRHLKPPEPPKPIDPLAEFKRQFDQALGLEKSGQVPGEALGEVSGRSQGGSRSTGTTDRRGAGLCRDWSVSQHHLKQFDEAVTAYEEALRRWPMNTTLKRRRLHGLRRNSRGNKHG
jgi:hypothetical protein